jgi:tetratricopeptide (TPR) repeat protein
MTVHEYDLKGYELLVKEDWDAAIELYTEALAEHPGDSYLSGRRCDAWERKGEPEKALAEYTRQIEMYPYPCGGRAGGFNGRGSLYERLGEYDKAIADFTECIPMAGRNYGIYWVKRAIAYRKKGDLDAALADLNEAMKAWEDPECTGWTLYQRSLVWEQKGEMEKALADLTQATINDPNDHECFYHLGLFLFNHDEPEKAAEELSKAIALKGDAAWYWLARGVAYWNTCVKHKTGFWSDEGETMDLAEENFTKAIELDPTTADAYLDRGVVRCAKAVESNNFIKAILTGKATDEAQRALLMAQLEHIGGHDLVPGTDAMLRGLRSNRDEAEELMGKSLGLFAEYDARGAVEDLTRAAELDPDNTETFYQRGVAYTLLGERDKALADYDQVLTLDPDHARAAAKRDALLSVE